MNSQVYWPSTMSHVASHLYRSFGYASPHDRADALHNAILRLLSLQNTSGLGLKDEELRKWLHCVASRMLLDARRMTMRTTLFSDLPVLRDSQEIADDELGHVGQLGHVNGGGYVCEHEAIDISYALQSLSPSLRACFELHSQGFHADEIAFTLGLSRDAVHKRIQRARFELQRNLHEYL